MGDPTLAKSLNILGIALLVLTGVVLLVMVILIFVPGTSHSKRDEQKQHVGLHLRNNQA